MDIRHTARIGVFYLEEAILEVLKEAGKPLTAKEIALELGVRFWPHEHGIHLVEGILYQLEVDKRVESAGSGSTKTYWIDDIFLIPWTAERFRKLISDKSGKNEAVYEKKGQIESLSKLGVDLMNLVESNQWRLSHKFWEHNFGFYFGHKRGFVFGINLYAKIPRLWVKVSKDDLIDREDDWINSGIMKHRHEEYRSDVSCAIYSRGVEVADIEQMLTFAYEQWNDEKRK